MEQWKFSQKNFSQEIGKNATSFPKNYWKTKLILKILLPEIIEENMQAKELLTDWKLQFSVIYHKLKHFIKVIKSAYKYIF